jgi:outer membrane protein assembly factor BamB
MPPRSRQVRRAAVRKAEKRGGARSAQGRSSTALARVPRPARAAAAAVLVAAVVAVAAVTLGSSSTGEPVAYTGSGYPNFNTSNTRYVGGPIDSSNVSKLEVAWSLPLTARSEYGSYSSAPIVADGVIYSQDLDSNVQAIDLKTGKALWTKTYDSPDQGPNGLVVQGGRVYGATTSAAFALEEKTGAQIWSVGLLHDEHQGIDIAPGYHDGIVYYGVVDGNTTQFYEGEGFGRLWALEGKTGRELWHFDTVPENLWSAAHININSGGGVWYTPAFDEHGFMYFGTDNPGPYPGTSQYPWGSSRPGPDLYTDSILKLNASTGKLQWYYQLTPHDLYDRDLQDPPILTNVGGTQVVITAGKGGFVLALDAQTGKLLWKRSVGIHNGHDNDDVYAMKHEYSKLHIPETVYPGLLGGVIAPMATNGSTVFVSVNNHPVTITSQTETSEPEPSTGELVALNTATGAVRWDQKLPAAAYGATTAVNDLVFVTDFAGELDAFDANTGSLVWQTKLPAGTNTGVVVSGNTVLAPAGVPLERGQSPELVAYRLPGGGG